MPEIAAWAADARKKGWEVRATPCGPNQAGRGSGVGALVRQPLQIIPWKATTEEYQQVHDLGRAALYKLEIDGKMMIFGVLYGATGGHGDTEAAQKPTTWYRY